MNKRFMRTFGFGGTGFLPVRYFKALNYRGRVRMWNLGSEILLRPQSLYFDIVHIIGTHTFDILSIKKINIR
jgi:hypothetical protein